MQSSREPPPPHRAAPSSPTDRSHSSTHSSVCSSFHTSESVPPPFWPPFFTMNLLTDQRLTGSIMPYHPVDHHHALGAPILDLFESPWHGLSRHRGQYIRASITTPESSSTSPQPLPWCRPSVSTAAQTPPTRNHRHHFCLHSYVLRSIRCPPRPFPASQPSSSTSGTQDVRQWRRC
jgi:hypothetical protein